MNAYLLEPLAHPYARERSLVASSEHLFQHRALLRPLRRVALGPLGQTGISRRIDSKYWPISALKWKRARREGLKPEVKSWLLVFKKIARTFAGRNGTPNLGDRA